MARNITQEERQLLKLIEKLPFPEEEKNAWSDRIRNGDMSDELAEEIRQKLTHHIEGEEDPSLRTRHLPEYTNLVRRWRLSSQSHNFGRR